MIALHALAPGKVNLSLVLGGARRDGRHELVTLIQSVSLADALTLRAAGRDAGGDRVVCPGVEGPNLAEEALRAYREATGWDAPPLELHIDKRVPIAAGMGGGSADAAAALRLAVAASGDPDGAAAASRIAPALGSDVPSQLEPGVVLGTGAGERVRRAALRRAHGLVIVPPAERLSTAEVYREADRLGLARPAAEVAEWRTALEAAAARPGALPGRLVVNDLEPAARSLRPSIDGALEAVRTAGAAHTLVSGSGPTVFGIFPGAGGPEAAERAAAALRGRHPGAVAAVPVEAAFGAPVAGA